MPDHYGAFRINEGIWRKNKTRTTGAAVAQEVEWLSANRKVAGSIPGLCLAKC